MKRSEVKNLRNSWKLEAGSWLSVVSYLLSVVSCWLLVFSFQFSKQCHSEHNAVK